MLVERDSRAISLQHALYFSMVSSFVAGFFFILSATHLTSDRAAALGEFSNGYREVPLANEERMYIDSEQEIGIVTASPRSS